MNNWLETCKAAHEADMAAEEALERQREAEEEAKRKANEQKQIAALTLVLNTLGANVQPTGIIHEIDGYTFTLTTANESKTNANGDKYPNLMIRRSKEEQARIDTEYIYKAIGFTMVIRKIDYAHNVEQVSGRFILDAGGTLISNIKGIQAGIGAAIVYLDWKISEEEEREAQRITDSERVEAKYEE